MIEKAITTANLEPTLADARTDDRRSQPLTERPFDTFYHPYFEIPIDFDELPKESMRHWQAEGDEVNRINKRSRRSEHADASVGRVG
jgi:hypothetical protein